MIERGEHFRFTLKAGDAVGIARELIGQDLDRDFALQLRVACTIHFTHSAATQQGQNVVRAETIACDDAHGLAFQFTRTVIGDGVSSVMVFNRNRWPSGETMYCSL